MTDGYDQKRITDLVHELDALQKELDEKKALVARVVRSAPGQKNWYSLYCDTEAALALRKWVDPTFVERKQKEHPCKKHKHHPKDGPCIPASQIPQGPAK